MGQFDLHKNPKGGAYPLLLDIQSEMLARLSTRVVAPLMTVKRYGARPITRLNPIVKIKGVDHVIVFQELAAIPASALGDPVSSLVSRRADLIAALDLLFTGI